MNESNFSSNRRNGVSNESCSKRGVLKGIVSESTNSSPIGLDTVKIRVEEFSIESCADIEPCQEYVYSTGETLNSPLWKDPSGEVVYGKKATLNTDIANVTVLRTDYMAVQVSLPEILRGNNNIPASSTKSISEALNKLESHLEKEGIHCKLKDCTLDRVDVCRNVRTDTPISDFKEPLRDLEISYLSPRDTGYDGMKWDSIQDSKKDGYSSQREITFYNKSSEAGLEMPNIQRLEYRLQRPRAIKSHIRELTTTDLCRDLTWMRNEFRKVVEELFPEPPTHLKENRPKDPGSQSSAPLDEVSGNAQSVPKITTNDLKSLLAEIRSANGARCHCLNRLSWILLWLVHPEPEELWRALKRAAESDVGPSGGKYAARDKVQEARAYARMIDEDLKAEDERLARLRRKLLS